MATQSIRSLLPRVASVRSDIDETHRFTWALRQALRWVCRTTLMARYTLPDFELNADAHLVTLTDPSSAGYQILRIHRVQAYNTTDTRWKDLVEENYFNIQNSSEDPFAVTGFPTHWALQSDWADRGVQLCVFPSLADATNLRVTVSVMPHEDSPETLNVSLPPEAEDAIVYRALGHMYEVPGDQRDLKVAKYYNDMADNEAATLKAIAAHGGSGTRIAEFRTLN